MGGVNPHSATGTYRVSDRSKVQKVIEWIDAGAAIDHNAVWNGQPDARRGVNGDGYQIALSASLQSFYSGNLVVGYWDAFANITTVKVSARGIALNPHTPNGNGTHVFDLTPALPLTKHDNIVVEAIDAAGNRSVIEKTVRQLLLESETHRGEARLTPEPTIYAPGDTLKFTVDAPAHAGQFYLVAMSEGIQPGYEAAGLNLDLYLLPNLDTWLVNSILAGVQGPLDSDGLGIYTMPTTGGMPPVELYCTAIVLTGGGLAAKSNIEAIQIK